jgi:hypothetical protein
MRGGLSIGYVLSKYLDRGVFEYIGPNGLSMLNYKLSAKLNRLDDGIVTNYASYMIISILLTNILLFSYLLKTYGLSADGSDSLLPLSEI